MTVVVDTLRLRIASDSIVTALANPQSAKLTVTNGNALGYSFSKEPAAAGGTKEKTFPLGEGGSAQALTKEELLRQGLFHHRKAAVP
jgi:hypothetical protein